MLPIVLKNDAILGLKSSLLETVIGNKKSMGIIASTCFAAHIVWKLLRKLSLSGDSNNPIIKYLHNILRKYMNQGWLVQGEFYPAYPWRFLVFLKKRHVIINFGSYGTVPKKILRQQILLQEAFEYSPVVFNRTMVPVKYEESRMIVAQHVGCHPENLVFADNITYGINAVLKSLFCDLKPTDVVIYTNLTYDAVIKTLEMLSKTYNVQILKVNITFPIYSEEEFCGFFENVFKSNFNVKIAVLDHISSASAILWPVKKLAKLCKDYEVISVVDGAHAPGQIELQIESLGVDIYAANLHKWYYAPKTCGIVYVDPSFQDRMQPNVISHGAYGDFHTRFFKQGTKNYAAIMVAGQATQFMDKIGGISHIQEYVTPLVEWAVKLFEKEWGTEELKIPESMKVPYMRIVYLPKVFNQFYKSGYDLTGEMINEYNLSIFFKLLEGHISTRVSGQIFSTKADYYYAAACVKHKANELEKKFQN